MASAGRAGPQGRPLIVPVLGAALCRYVLGMDPQRAHELLARERERLEQAIARLAPGPARAGVTGEGGDPGSEDLYQHELDAGLAEDLAEQLAALERAESRLADGTYGLSVESGDVIPDKR